MTDDHHSDHTIDDHTIDDHTIDDHTIDDYDTVTARDIAGFLHYYADMRCAPGGPDPEARAAFLDRKADLFTRMANKAARGRPASYTDPWIEQVRQMATDARAAANKARLELLPQQRVGPEPRRTTDRQPATGGATSEEKSGATSG
jgi:hypothetical protein